jgi:hypothetical protein
MTTPIGTRIQRSLIVWMRMSLSLIVMVWLSACGSPTSAPDVEVPEANLPGFNLDRLGQIQLGDRHLASDRSFSFQPPANWQIEVVTGLAYATFVQADAPNPVDASPTLPSDAAIEAPGDPFKANISIFSDTYSGTVDDYAAVNLSSVSKAFANFQILSQTEFSTNSDLAGIVIVAKSEQLGNQLWQSFYIFDAPGQRKLVITCTALASEADRFAPIFAASIKTLQIESGE